MLYVLCYLVGLCGIVYEVIIPHYPSEFLLTLFTGLVGLPMMAPAAVTAVKNFYKPTPIPDSFTNDDVEWLLRQERLIHDYDEDGTDGNH